MSHGFLILAQAGGGNSPFATLALLGAMMVVMYVLMILPTQRQQKQHRALLDTLKKGDEVVTQSGLMGKIHSLADKVVTLEIANGVRVRVLKQSIQGLMGADEDAASKSDEKKEEKK